MKSLIVCCVFSLICAGCSKRQPQAGPDFTTIRPFSDQASQTASKIANLEGRISFLEFTKMDIPSGTVAVDVTTHTYQKINSSPLPLLLSAVNASPYLDGFRVTLSIANPYAITFHGFSLVAWTHSVPLKFSSPTHAAGSATNIEAYNAGCKKRVVDLTDTLYPGHWNEITFDLAPATPEELRSLEIGIDLKEAGGP